MYRLYLRCVLLGTVALMVSSEDTCPAVKNDCTCEFDASAEDGGEPVVAETTSKTEVLAAAAGAMTPLLLGGAGLGIYKLVKGKSSDSLDMDRPDSEMSNDGDDTGPTQKRPLPKDNKHGPTVLTVSDANQNATRRTGGIIGF